MTGGPTGATGTVGRVRLDPTPEAVALVIRNTILTLATFGFGRFWARTRWRRYLWRRIAVRAPGADHDDRLEYRGEGAELMLGVALYALALVPVWIALQLGYFVMGTETVGQWTRAFVMFAVVILVVASVSRFRARRYRLAATTWRGVGFEQGGSAWGFLRASSGWAVAAIASAGFLVPRLRLARQEYLVNHARFGALPLRLECDPARLDRAWLTAWPWLAAPLAYLMATEAEAMIALPFPEFQITATGAWVGMLALIIGVSAMIIYRVEEMRVWIEGLRIGPLRARLTARWRDLLGPIFGYLAILIATGLIAAMIWAARLEAIEDALGGPLADLAGRAILPLALAIAHMIAWPLVFQIPFLRRALAALEIEGLDQLAGAASPAPRPPATGEGVIENFEID